MGMFDPPRGMFVVDTQDTSSLGGILMDYLRNVASGQVAASGALGQNFYDPNRSFAQNALDPRALANATDIGMSLGMGPIRAYHGSPYDFDKFDLAKIGTGEGAQAYGHGLYFAENEAVARGYRDALSLGTGPGFTGTLDKLAWESQGKNLTPADVRAIFSKHPGIDVLANDDGAIAAFRGLAGEYKGVEAPTSNAAIRYYRQLDDALRRYTGKMYEVNINASPEQFLNWDALATQQPGNVSGALANIWQSRGGTLEGRQYPPFAAHNEARGDSLHAALASSVGTPADASKLLNQAGIPGIRYLDQGSRQPKPIVEFTGKQPRWAAGDLAILRVEDSGDVAKAIDGLKSDLAMSRNGGYQTNISLYTDAIKWLNRNKDNFNITAPPQTSNYVVFNPDIIEILRKYGIVGPIAMPGAMLPFMGEPQQ